MRKKNKTYSVNGYVISPSNVPNEHGGYYWITNVEKSPLFPRIQDAVNYLKTLPKANKLAASVKEHMANWKEGEKKTHEYLMRTFKSIGEEENLQDMPKPLTFCGIPCVYYNRHGLYGMNRTMIAAFNRMQIEQLFTILLTIVE